MRKAVQYAFDHQSPELLSMDVSIPASCVQMTPNPRSFLIHFAYIGDLENLQKIIDEKRAELGIDPITDDEEDEDIHPDMYEFLNAENEHGFTALFVAATEGHGDITKALISAGADVDSADRHGRSSLFMASYKGHTECAWALLKSGAEINGVEERRTWTSLHAAAFSRNQNMIKIILAAAVEDGLEGDKHPVFAIDRFGRTPLLVAFENPAKNLPSSLEGCIKCLMGVDADLGHKDFNQMTALHLCAKYGHEEAAQYILEISDDYRTDVDMLGRTPFHLAALYGNDKLAEQLSSYELYSTLDCTGLTPFHCACLNGHVQTTSIILENFLNQELNEIVTAPDSMGRQPVHALTQTGDADIEKAWEELYNAGADFNAKDHCGRTPLMYLALALHSERCSTSTAFILKKGAKIDLLDNSQRSCLHYVGFSGNLFFLDSLIRCAPCDVVETTARRYDNMGLLPLHLAVQNATNDLALQTMKKLISMTGGINVPDMKGRTPVALAALNGQSRALDQLLHENPNLRISDYKGRSPVLQCFVKTAQVEALQQLIRSLPGPSEIEEALAVRDHQGQGLLHYLAKARPFEEGIHFLEENDPLYFGGEGLTGHLNIPDKSGVSPYHLAAQAGNLLFLERIVSKNLSLTGCDSEGRTAAHFAGWGGHSDIVDYCLGSHFRFNNLDLNGRSVLHYAASSCNVSLIKLLVDEHPSLMAQADNSSRLPVCYVLLPPKSGNIFSAERNPLGSLKYLLEHEESDAGWMDEESNTLLHLAGLSSSDDVLNYLLEKGCSPLAANEDGHIPIHTLMRGRARGEEKPLGVFSLFLEQGYRDHVDTEGRTLLHWAAAFNSANSLAQIVDVLGEKASDALGTQDKAGFSPLMVACRSGSADCTRFLLDQSPNWSILASNGDSCLHLSVRSGSSEVSKMLLNFVEKQGKKEVSEFVNQKNQRGDTALHLAVVKERNECVEVLCLNPHIDIDTQDRKGKIPFEIARRNSFTEIQEHLEARKKKNSRKKRNWKTRVGTGYSKSDWIPERAKVEPPKAAAVTTTTSPVAETPSIDPPLVEVSSPTTQQPSLVTDWFSDSSQATPSPASSQKSSDPFGDDWGFSSSETKTQSTDIGWGDFGEAQTTQSSDKSLGQDPFQFGGVQTTQVAPVAGGANESNIGDWSSFPVGGGTAGTVDQNQEVQRLKDDLARALKQYQSSQEELLDVHNEMDGLKAKVEELQETNQELTQQSNGLKTRATVAEQGREEIRQQANTMWMQGQEQVRNLEAQIAELKEATATSVSADVAKQEAEELARLKKETEEAKERQSRQAKEIEEISEREKQQAEEISRLKQKLIDQESEASEAKRTLEEQLNQERESSRTLEEELTKMRDQGHGHDQQRQQLLDEHSKIKGALEEQLNQEKESSRSLGEELVNSQKQGRISEEELGQHKQNNEKLQQQLLTEQEGVKVVREELEKEKNSKGTLELEATTLREKIQKYEEERKSIEPEMGDLRMKLTEANRQIESLNKAGEEHTSLRQKYEEMAQDNMNLQDEKAQFNKEREALRSKKEASDRELKELKAANARLEQEVKTLTSSSSSGSGEKKSNLSVELREARTRLRNMEDFVNHSEETEKLHMSIQKTLQEEIHKLQSQIRNQSKKTKR